MIFVFSVSNNYLNADAAKFLAEALHVNTSLTELNIRYNDIGKDGAVALAEALKANASMKKMNVLSNSIGDEGYEILTKVAEEKGILTLVGFDEGQTEANLSYQRLGPIDAKLIARELTTGFVSTSLNSLE